MIASIWWVQCEHEWDVITNVCDLCGMTLFDYYESGHDASPEN
jgi:hypothetical protein